MTVTLCTRPASDRPAPRPAVTEGGRSSSTLVTAAVVVVLPMPISPAASRAISWSSSSMAICAPAIRAVWASSRLMAGPFVMSAVPGRTDKSRTPGTGAWASIPTSTGTTFAPATRAMWHTEEHPSPKALATAKVTSCPVWVTPWATTPLSEQNTATALAPRDRSVFPVAPATRTSISSRWPKPLSGLAIASQFFRQPSMAL